MDESHDEPAGQIPIRARLIDALYTEAMILADEARSYFDQDGREQAGTLPPFDRVGFACESLKVTTRIMHIVAWLLTQRAIESGELSRTDGRRPERKIGHAQDSDPELVAKFPPAARRLIEASSELYARVRRLAEGQPENVPTSSPARALMGRLERGLGGQLG